jgi:hypothetical protein
MVIVLKPMATFRNNNGLTKHAHTGRWGFSTIFKHLSGFEFFLLPSRFHACPSASQRKTLKLSNKSLSQNNFWKVGEKRCKAPGFLCSAQHFSYILAVF